MKKSTREYRKLANKIANDLGESVLIVCNPVGEIEYALNVHKFDPPMKTVSEEVRYLKVQGQDMLEYMEKQTVQSYVSLGIEKELEHIPIVEYTFSDNYFWTMVNRIG